MLRGFPAGAHAPGQGDDRSVSPGPPRVVGLLLGVALLLGGAVFLTGEHRVVLTVDGQTQEVVTHAGSVGELLARAGLDVGEADHVHPGVDTRLQRGLRVEVVHAREITLLIGEDAERVIVTALTVDEVLEQMGGQLPVAAARRSLVHPSRGDRVWEGMVVEVSQPVPLTVAHDGRLREVITDEATLGALLDRLGVELDPDDRVIPGLAHPPEPGILVTVQRVAHDSEWREEPIAFPTVERPTAELEQGIRREVQAGRDGVRVIVDEVTRVDGREESRTRLRTDITAEPTPRIVEVGTAQKQAARAPAPPPAETQEAPAGAQEPAGAQPPADANVQEGKASWYDNPYGGYTAAHRTLPRGTIVTVTNVSTGKQVQVRVNDRGPFVDGRIIDLNRAAFAEIASTGKGVVRVRITW